MVDHAHLLEDLTEQERFVFQIELSAKRKEVTAGVLLALFLGGFGAHRFYMGQPGMGVLYILFCWTFVPLIVSLVEIFLVPGRIRRFNSEAARQTVLEIKALRSGLAHTEL